MIRKVLRWLLTPAKGPFRFREADILLWWVLIGMIAISLVADRPASALSVAIGGGVLIGILSVIGEDSR